MRSDRELLYEYGVTRQEFIREYRVNPEHTQCGIFRSSTTHTQIALLVPYQLPFHRLSNSTYTHSPLRTTMSATLEATTSQRKKFQGEDRHVPHHSQKAKKYYPAEDERKPRKVSELIGRYEWRYADLGADQWRIRSAKLSALISPVLPCNLATSSSFCPGDTEGNESYC